MSIKVKTTGNLNNIETYLLKHRENAITIDEINNIADIGLELFRKNTPSNSGKTRDSWSYEIIKTNKGIAIEYNNSNIQNGLNIAILIDNGHATPSGKWVSGSHYIDTTIKEICSKINKMK